MEAQTERGVCRGTYVWERHHPTPRPLTFPPHYRPIIHPVTQVHAQEPSLTCPAPHPPTRPASSRASPQLHARPVCFSPRRPLPPRSEPPATLAWAPRSLLTGPLPPLGILSRIVKTMTSCHDPASGHPDGALALPRDREAFRERRCGRGSVSPRCALPLVHAGLHA